MTEDDRVIYARHTLSDRVWRDQPCLYVEGHMASHMYKGEGYSHHLFPQLSVREDRGRIIWYIVSSEPPEHATSMGKYMGDRV